jgi:hypothetical protein
MRALQTSDKLMVIYFSLDSSKIALLGFVRLRWEIVFLPAFPEASGTTETTKQLAAERHE